jgi:hypothetical protein
LTSNGKLICYYSDQRDNATYGQTLVRQTSSDLKKWGAVIEDVTYPTYTDRPGMPVVTKVRILTILEFHIETASTDSG